MGNPIKFTDLFDKADIDAGIKGLKTEIQTLVNDIKTQMQSIRDSASGLGSSMAGGSSATKSGRDTTRAQADEADRLYNAYTKLDGICKTLSTQLDGLSKAEAKNTKAIEALATANDKAADVLEKLKANAELAKIALEGMVTSGDTAQIKQLQQAVSVLERQVAKLSKAGQTQTNTNNNNTRSNVDLMQSYSLLSDLIQKTGVDLNSLSLSEKAIQQIKKQGEIANGSLAGSYNQLSAQYNLIKIALNAMGKEMRENIDIGKVWESQAMEIMTQMKNMQEATGKHTLSVGEYTKAFNGLSISTQQVLRELPTLANSLQMFFIAISNNVPIFIDNFKRAREELGGFKQALRATLGVVASWQTVLLGVLTALPMVVKAIKDKKKAQEEANQETEKAITLEQLLNDAYINVHKSTITASSKIRVLASALKDENRSLESRIKIGRVLKDEWATEFANYSAEEIAMGKATTNIENLTKRLVAEAKAKGLLNQISDLSIKQYDIEIRMQGEYATGLADLARLEKAVAVQKQFKAKMDAEAAKNLKTLGVAEVSANTQEKYRALTEAVVQLNAKFQASRKTYEATKKEYLALADAIATLEKKIDPDALITTLTSNVEDGLRDIPSYYNDMLQAIINLQADGLQKELAQLDLNYKIQREKLQEQQDELQAMLQKANGEEKERIKEQMAWVATTLVLAEENYYKTRERMWQKHLTSFRKEEVEEEDPEAEALKELRTRLETEKTWLDRQAIFDYQRDMKALQNKEHTYQDEYNLKKALNDKLAQNEKTFWENYLKELEANGLEMTEEYANVVKRLAQIGGTSSQTSTRRKRGSKVYRNLTEAIFAHTSTFGEKDENGIAKIKDEYMDWANAINEALSSTMQYMNEWMDKRIEMAEVAVQAAQKETEASKTALDAEMQARANGYANNVEMARKEYEEKVRAEKKAIAEREKLQKIQEGINSAQQASSLITATANIISAYSNIPVVGQVLSLLAIGAMWSMFAAAKIQAAQMTTYGEGMGEYLDYGGSHASGNDIDFGRSKDGKRRRVERGEVIGVINKRNVRKYGVGNVLGIINALNNGTYPMGGDSNASLMASILRSNAVLGSSLSTTPLLGESGLKGLKMADIEANYGMAFSGLNRGTDLSSIEQGIGTLVEQGETRVVQTADGRIEYRGNNKRIIRNG